MNKRLIIITKDAPIPLTASPVRMTCGLLFEIQQAIIFQSLIQLIQAPHTTLNAGDATAEKYTQTALSEPTFQREREPDVQAN